MRGLTFTMEFSGNGGREPGTGGTALGGTASVRKLSMRRPVVSDQRRVGLQRFSAK